MALERAHWEIEGESYSARIEDGLVRVRLPYRVDRGALTHRLRDAGFFVAHDPDREHVTTQGWGPEEDHEDYYPYWLLKPDTFAFPPRDYQPTREGFRPELGPRARAELERWLPYLSAARAH